MKDARDVVHDAAGADAFDCGTDWSGTYHMPLCDRLTAAIEADRIQRMGLDPVTVEACAKDMERTAVALEKLTELGPLSARLWCEPSLEQARKLRTHADVLRRSLAAQPRGEKL